MTMKNLNGDSPQMVRNPEGQGIKRLFYSESDLALRKGKTVSGGYGVLKAGTVMAVNASAAGGKGQLVPYVPVYGSIVFGADSAIGIAPLVADGVSGSVKVLIADSYKFQVGDDLIIANTAGDYLVNNGAISAIDRTTSTTHATITCQAYTATNVTLAKGAYCFTEAGTTPFSLAKFILDKDVNTGVGEDAAGALASVIISNAILYTGSLVNMTAEAITSLGAVTDGQHTILK